MVVVSPMRQTSSHSDAPRYALALRKRMDERGLSRHELGKLTHPDNPETGRRNVRRHLSGNLMPSRESQMAYAKALDAPELAPQDAPEDDAVSDDPLMRELRARVDDLMADLERALRVRLPRGERSRA